MTRRVRQTRAEAGYSDEQREALLRHDWFHAFSGGMAPPYSDREGSLPYRIREDEKARINDRMRAAWNDLRDELLPMWIAEHPGTRPRAWWMFDAPEPRRCLTGPHRFTLPEYADHEPEYYLGVPAFAVGPTFGIGEEYESERAYLERLDLLTETESQPAADAPAVTESN